MTIVRRGVPTLFAVSLGALLTATSVRAEGSARRLPDELVHGFDRALGIELVRARSIAQIPGFPLPSVIVLEPSLEATKRFGAFRVRVYDSTSDAELLLHAGGVPRRLRPDSHGIYWTEAPDDLKPKGDPPTWVASKLYGRVLLQWWSSTPQVNATWRRLDNTISHIVTGREKPD